MVFAMVIRELLLKNIEDVSPIEEFRLDVYLLVHQTLRDSGCFRSAVGRGRAGRPDHDQQHCYHQGPTVNQRLLLQLL